MENVKIQWAAIRYSSKIFTGANHSECLIAARRSCEQGFIAVNLETDEQFFVSRKEALRIALAAGQVVKKHNPKDELLSEDLRG